MPSGLHLTFRSMKICILMVGTSGSNSIIQVKYGLLFRSFCDAVDSYCYYRLPYAGKPDSLKENNVKKYYMSGMDEYTIYLLNGVSQFNNIRGTNISKDRYFTSVTVADWVNQEDVTLVGTIRLDSIGLPKGIKEVNEQE